MVKRVIKSLRRFFSDQRGDAYIGFIIKFLVTMSIVASLISVYSIFVKHQAMVSINKRVVRAMEVSGANDAAITTLFNSMCNTQGLSGATLQVTDVSYLSGGRIQLRNTFTTVLRYPMQIKILDATGSRPPVYITLTLESRLSGMSEVFWR